VYILAFLNVKEALRKNIVHLLRSPHFRPLCLYPASVTLCLALEAADAEMCNSSTPTSLVLMVGCPWLEARRSLLSSIVDEKVKKGGSKGFGHGERSKSENKKHSLVRFGQINFD
jgi:hypothetical protein